MRTQHHRVFILAAGVAALAHAQALYAQADDCANATPIGEGTFSGDTSAATNDGSAACGASETSPDVWYSFTPPEDCLLMVNTCGSLYDTVLSIHSGCPGTPDNELACNDDTCQLQSFVSVEAQATTTYLIRIAGWQGATGPFTLTLQCAAGPSADDCSDALTVDQGTFFGTTVDATNDGSAGCGESASSPDVWYSFTAVEDCLLRVDTCGTSYDTVLSIHSECPGTDLNELACNDDACALQSRVQVSALAGSEYLIRVSGYSGATGPFQLTVSCTQVTEGADVLIGELTTLGQFGRVGDVVGCALDSPVCNAGSEPLDWFGNPDPRHPFMVFNMYRLMDGRFEQIGQSWVKHGFASAQADACGLGCIPWPDSTRTGIGCSDTYGAGLNAVQSGLGPRSEINPWTGAFTYEGSHMHGHSGGHDAIEHRLQIRDADLDPATNPGASYFCELYVLAHDDANHMNSVAREPVIVSGTPGGTWSFNISASNTHVGPAIEAWPGASLTVIPEEPVDDGRCILGVQATANGDGTWHYEYALYNHDMDREVRAFTIPAAASITLTNVGFHAAELAGDIYDNDDWTWTRDGDSITWATGTYDDHPDTNPLRWGAMYNFRFDADSPPMGSIATLTLYKPGTPTELNGRTQGPGGEPPIPTVSQWGLIVLTILILVTGTIAFARRTAQAS